MKLFFSKIFSLVAFLALLALSPFSLEAQLKPLFPITPSSANPFSFLVSNPLPASGSFSSHLKSLGGQMFSLPTNSFFTTPLFPTGSTKAQIKGLPSLSQAASSGSNNPFGGRVAKVFPCNCSDNYWITVIPPRSGLPKDLIYDRTTITYEYKKVTSVGVQLLGTWQGQAVCLIVDPGSGCDPVMVAPRMFMVGTSK